jgi:hypothetical protein
MNKLQTVYKLVKPSEDINTGIIVKYIHSGRKFPVSETKAFVFTPEEFKQLLQDYTDKIVEKVKLEINEDGESKKAKTYKADIDYLSEVSGDLKVKIDKESITAQLPKFLKEKGYE